MFVCMRVCGGGRCEKRIYTFLVRCMHTLFFESEGVNVLFLFVSICVSVSRLIHAFLCRW